MKNQSQFGRRNLRLATFISLSVVVILSQSCSKNTDDPTPPVATFGNFWANALEDTLKNRNVGYAFAIYENNQLTAASSGGFQSRTTEAEGQKNFTIDTKLHIASMSKTLAAIAFVKLAQQKGIKTTDKIVNYLPPTWTKGVNINQVTFADLMTHRSGITGFTNSCLNGSYSENIWVGLAQIIQKGVTTRGNYCYQNANFGLFRVLIPSILGYKFTGNASTDDAETQKMYLSYLQSEIFDKVGVKDVQFMAPNGNPTYTYDFPYSGAKGWNQGSFTGTLGAYGLYLTASEAAKIYSGALSTGQTAILTETQKDTLIQKGFGNYKGSTSIATFNYHDGWWYGGTQGIRTIWMKFPNDRVVVLFVNALQYNNSTKTANFPFNNGNIVGLVYNAYAKAQTLKAARNSIENEPLVLEYPEAH
jgi:CubicO group peptidase (beta-lactamase class C family)